ncbi:hypothetical protein RIR_jg40504.t1 [Rhizophagus irregularis DAOM 181602=DAOM 197198]|nr:hypothetical protein RIR_jg40504.t1 [Rhizophagus irregularis DAOM 181602=DAOM 197198]
MGNINFSRNFYAILFRARKKSKRSHHEPEHPSQTPHIPNASSKRSYHIYRNPYNTQSTDDTMWIYFTSSNFLHNYCDCHYYRDYSKGGSCMGCVLLVECVYVVSMYFVPI